MPQLMDMTPMSADKAMQHYVYTGQTLEKLGGDRYTLVTLVLDCSPSIEEYIPDMEKMCAEVIGGCKKGANSEAIMFRFTGFHEDVFEMQGFTELRHYDPDQFKGAIKMGSATALWEATLDAIAATQAYGAQLVAADYMCNAVMYIITDGKNNIRGHATPALVSETLKQIRQDEGANTVESINTILIAASDSSDVVGALEIFFKNAGLNQLVKMGEATAENLAKLGNFVTSSVSSTSQVLGSGGPSTPATF